MKSRTYSKIEDEAPKRRRAEPANTLATTTNDQTPDQPTAILQMQHTHGNAAVVRMLAGRAANAPALGIQRDDDDDANQQQEIEQATPVEDVTPEPSTDTAAVDSTSSDDASGVATSTTEDAEPGETTDDQPEGATDSASADTDPSTDDAGGDVMTQSEDAALPQGTAETDSDLHIKTVPSTDEQATAPPITTRFVNGGRRGTVPVKFEALAANDRRPHAFTNGGQTGTIVWAGGGGAGPHGNENTGSIQAQNAPDYQSKSNGVFSNSDAWIKAATGTSVDVTRSYLGANAGDQGNGHYVTPGAAARFNSHEILHVNSTQGIYTANIPPLIARAATYLPGGTVAHAFTQSGAITELKKVILWKESLDAFSAADTAQNKPMGPVDTNDIATGTYPVDAGAGTVGGVAFQHRVRLPTEANPA